MPLSFQENTPLAKRKRGKNHYYESSNYDEYVLLMTFDREKKTENKIDFVYDKKCC